MRHAVAFVLISISFLAPARAARFESAAGSEPDTTIVLHFEGIYSAAAIAEMKMESGRILEAAGLRLGWTSSEAAAGQSFRDLVVITFRGACMFQPGSPRYMEPGPYATTLTTDGMVQPFATVDCDHVARAASGAMSGSDYAHANLLIGRALGRVVAHELVHMLTRSGQHGHDGVETPSLTARQLIETSLTLGREDANRLRHGLQPR